MPLFSKPGCLRAITLSVAAYVWPGIALACKPVDPDAFAADAIAGAWSLWFFAFVLCALICAVDLGRRRLSKAAIVAVAVTVFFPAWTLPPSPFGFGCAVMNVMGAYLVLGGLGLLLVRAIWRWRRSPVRTEPGP